MNRETTSPYSKNMSALQNGDPSSMNVTHNVGEEGVHSTKVLVLFVPGFVADTYSEIERSFVELCSSPNRNVEYLWLVPHISCKYNRFAKSESRHTLIEPVWVPHLRTNMISYIVADVSKYNLLSNFLLFRTIFSKYPIDAVYTHFGFERFWAAFFGRLWGKVTIWNEHWHSLGRRYALLKRIFYKLFVDEFISISRFITNTLPRTARVHTLANAVHLDVGERTTQERQRSLRKELGMAEDTKLVLMVAAFRPEKRHTIALEVCKRILRCRSDTVFAFLGEGELREPFVRSIAEQGMERHLIAPGHVDNVEDYYAIADVSILTSQNEPFGYVVLEAMRRSLPILAFDSGGPAEVVRTGETGFLVKDGDVDEFTRKLLELLDSEPLRTTIGRRAREAVKRGYSRDEWIAKLNATLKDLAVARRRT